MRGPELWSLVHGKSRDQRPDTSWPFFALQTFCGSFATYVIGHWRDAKPVDPVVPIVPFDPFVLWYSIYGTWWLHASNVPPFWRISQASFESSSCTSRSRPLQAHQPSSSLDSTHCSTSEPFTSSTSPVPLRCQIPLTCLHPYAQWNLLSPFPNQYSIPHTRDPCRGFLLPSLPITFHQHSVSTSSPDRL